MHRVRASALIATLGTVIVAGVVVAAPLFSAVRPDPYDPGGTFLVQATWLAGIGCPTNATFVDYYNADAPTTYTDPACPTGDPADDRNTGLLLAKTGPTANDAEPFVELSDVKGLTITELGYDLRKPTGVADRAGSTCSVQAPMFQVVASSGVYYVGCQSPSPTSQSAGNGWLRLRWTVSIADVQATYILSQDGQTGPGTADENSFGLSVIDNIDVNGVLVGRASAEAGTP
jgi:hypothetical protein